MTTGARQEILERIRRANTAATATPIRTHPIPARARGTATELRQRFVAMAREAAATVDHVESLDALPSAIGSFLDEIGSSAYRSFTNSKAADASLILL